VKLKMCDGHAAVTGPSPYLSQKAPVRWSFTAHIQGRIYDGPPTLVSGQTH
jgi:hypothetical protein